MGNIRNKKNICIRYALKLFKVYFFVIFFFFNNSIEKKVGENFEKKGLKITFINPNTEEQIVQAMAGVLAYNLAEK